MNSETVQILDIKATQTLGDTLTEEKRKAIRLANQNRIQQSTMGVPNYDAGSAEVATEDTEGYHPAIQNGGRVNKSVNQVDATASSHPRKNKLT